MARAPLRSFPKGSICRTLCGLIPPSKRCQSDFARLKEEMLSRRPNVIWDFPTPIPNQILLHTLHHFLPQLKTQEPDQFLPFGRHLIYFPSATDITKALPDGTDPLHSPGPPYTCRLWAGGSIYAPSAGIPMTGRKFRCVERIINVQARGLEGEEKVFVDISRRMFPSSGSPGRLPSVDEVRTLVFMRQLPRSAPSGASLPPQKIIKPSKTPSCSRYLTPTRELLFRFSALTLNAHAIHLDKRYCQEQEGHRNLLVHGPLSLVLMLEVLRTYIHRANTLGKYGMEESINRVNYRNLAPLYVDETMQVCVRENRSQLWDLWIVNSDGGLAVTGSAETKYIKKDPNRLVQYKLSLSRAEKAIPKAEEAQGGSEDETVAIQNEAKEDATGSIPTEVKAAEDRGKIVARRSSSDGSDLIQGEAEMYG